MPEARCVIGKSLRRTAELAMGIAVFKSNNGPRAQPDQ